MDSNTNPIREIKVLIVDDNPVDRAAIRGMLANLDLRDVVEAENGAIAESKLSMADQVLRPFGLVLVDWQMPTMNGLTFLRHVRMKQELKGCKIILMTGNSERELVQEAIRIGVDDFLVKPIAIETLEAKLRHHLR